MGNSAKVIWTLIVLLIIGLLTHLCLKKNDSGEFINKIDSLESKIDSIRTLKDSVEVRIDTVTKIIEKNTIKYEESRNTILTNTTDENYLFFCNYIERNKARLSSYSNK